MIHPKQCDREVTQPIKPTVAIVQNPDLNQLIEGSLTLLNLKSRIKPSMKVLIKPNLVRAPPDVPVKITPTPKEPAPFAPHVNKGIAWARTVTPEGDITRTESVEALLKYLQRLGVENITIAEASGKAIFYTLLWVFESRIVKNP